MSHLESPITPSIGRIVLVRGEPVNFRDPQIEYPAIVTAVRDQNFVSLMVFAPIPRPFHPNVQYHSDTDILHDRIVWRWMDYQVQTAAKSRDVLGHHGAVIGEPVEVSTPLSRVKAEHAELDQRWNKLSAFLVSESYETLSPAHRALLLEQQEIMGMYGRILTKRIALLEREA